MPKPHPLKPAIVIGSGFGGLAAAVRLRAMGWPVLLLEARDQPGGRASVFERDGFSFDAGPTVITAPYLLHELFEMVGRDSRDYFELMPVDPFYRIEFHDGSRFDYFGDDERLLEQIRQLNPPDVDNYLRLLELMKRIFEVGYLQLGHVPFDRVGDMLRIVPQMMKLKSYRTVYGLVASHIQDDRLRQALTFEPLLIGGNPFATSSIYALIHWLERKWGVWFAKGGTTSIVKGLVRLLEDIGAEVRMDAPVARIEVADGRPSAVVLESGERIPCALVVSNADPTMVYQRMIAPEHRRKHTDRKLRRTKQSMSLVVGYFGTKRTYPELAHHTILLGPRYKGLLTDIFDRKVLAEDFSLYLHAPTRSDPGLAPPGHENFYVLSPVPNNQSGIDWSKEGEPYFDRILDALEARLLPGLRDNLVTQFFVTPDYFEQELRSASGAAFGPSPTLLQSAWFRYHNRSEDLDGLYFVGAGTHPGAGIPGVLSTARVLDRVVPAPGGGERVPVPEAVAHVAA